MSQRSLLASTAVVITAAALTATAGAQTRCAYDICALRVERNHILRGASGERVLHLGRYTDVANRLAWSSDTARAYAAMYVHNHGTASNLRLLGLAAHIGSSIISYQVYRDYRRQADEVNRQADAGGPVTARIEFDRAKLAAGTGLTVIALATRWGARRYDAIGRAQLARAVWWHNRELARREGVVAAHE